MDRIRKLARGVLPVSVFTVAILAAVIACMTWIERLPVVVDTAETEAQPPPTSVDGPHMYEPFNQPSVEPNPQGRGIVIER